MNMAKELRILILEDAPADAELMKHELRKGGIVFSSKRVETREGFIKGLREFRPHLIFGDYKLPSFDGLTALAIAQENCPDTPFIFISGTIGEDFAIETIKMGATDYVFKDRLSRLVPAVNRALREVEERTERKRAEEELRQSKEQLAADLEAMRRLQGIRALFLRGSSMQMVLDEIVETAIAIDGADMGNIQLLDPQSGSLKIMAHRGFEQAWLDFWDRVYSGQGTCGTALERGERVIVEDITQSPIFVGTPALDVQLVAGVRAVQSTPLLSHSGRLLGVFSTHFRTPHRPDERALHLLDLLARQTTDIIERAQTEEALRKSEERFKDLFDNAPTGYFEYDSQGRITNVNRTELEMLGYTFEEMIGQPVWEFIVEEEIARKMVLAKLAGTMPPSQGAERTYRRKDGTTFPSLVQDRLLRDAEGKVVGIRGTVQDITERKRAEQERAALQEQLRQSQKMEAIGQLAGGIAHDFNNLLTVIQGNCQLALMDLRKEDPLRKNIQEVNEASEKAASLTGQLLAFSRKQILEMNVLDLNLILQRLDKMLHRVLGEDIELVTILTEGIGKVKADPGQIEQVIVNLAVNSRDAMPEGGKLTIETTNVELDKEYADGHIGVQPGRYVMLSVSDTGVGMTPEVREKVFEPFFTTKEKGKGTGLGLSTVYGIVKQSEGNICVYSEPGQGTTFKIYLPQVDKPLTELKEEVSKEVQRGNETVLIVEDEETVRKLAVRMLKGLGYRVLEAPEGGTALLLCEEFKEPIHLILTDVVMLGMGGRKLVDRLKEIHPEMKVLYMSGYTDNAIVHHGVLGEGINFIHKPFTLDGLAKKVREALDKA